MISRNWFILESLFYAMRYKPEYPAELSSEEIIRAEGARTGMVKTVLPLLGMAKTIASKLPSSLIEEKLDGAWLMRRAKEKFPVLAERVEVHGEQGEKWLQKQAKEIRWFLMGKLRWDDRRRKLVRFRKVAKKT